ncbi:hypothetical protein J4481_01015 [Candidatus Pacearchaeota archaeon]|nr:hypothetical protein [Candidatus Pacearchaeota archaeon]
MENDSTKVINMKRYAEERAKEDIFSNYERVDLQDLTGSERDAFQQVYGSINDYIIDD